MQASYAVSGRCGSGAGWNIPAGSGIGTHDPVTYVAVAVVLGGIAFLANLVPAGRATQVQPVVALKYE